MIKRKRKMFLISIILLFVGSALGFVFAYPGFGRNPKGERLERIKKSPNYRDGQFWNKTETSVMAIEGKSPIKGFWDFLFKKYPDLKPSQPLDVEKIDLHSLSRNEDFIQWLGHSSIYMQIDTMRFLVDPILTNKWPESLMLKPFKGTNIYTPKDIPDIDYLIITHDHWDHLDYHTIKRLKNKVGKIICPLGVGQHLERWGILPQEIIEMDWDENIIINEQLNVHCLTARHFSGRTFKRNKTLWASFMLETPNRTIYLSGDGGYDTHFKDIGEQFKKIDIAFIENGQYNKDWQYIHLMPDEQVKVINDLGANAVLTTHHGKFALSKHPWKEPIELINEKSNLISSKLLNPIIGQLIYLNNFAFYSKE